jgi:hypothetical protein
MMTTQGELSRSIKLFGVPRTSQNGQHTLGDNLQTYVSARRELQAGTVYAALVKYLADQCSSSHPQYKLSLSSSHIGRLGSALP